MVLKNWAINWKNKFSTVSGKAVVILYRKRWPRKSIFEM